MVNIAVMGYGTVGSGVVEVINTNGATINQRVGDEIHIKYVLDLRDFPGDPIQEKIIHDFDTIVNDPEIQIVVEVRGGIYICEKMSSCREECGDLEQGACGKTRGGASFHRAGAGDQLFV